MWTFALSTFSALLVLLDLSMSAHAGSAALTPSLHDPVPPDAVVDPYHTPPFRARDNGNGRRRRRLLCLGIFRDCDEEEEKEEDEVSESEETNETSNTTESSDEDNGGGLLGDVELCLGIFRDCNSTNSNGEAGSEAEENVTNETSSVTTPSPTPAPVVTNEGDADADEDNERESSGTNCRESNNGIFGGRPLFGNCGIVTEYIQDVFGFVWNEGDTENEGVEAPSFEFVGSDEGPFGLGLLPEGGLLWRVWNGNDGDSSLIEIIMQTFHQNTQSLTSNFLEDWSVNAVTTNTTCVGNAAAPACFDMLGQPGFWVCRTLTDPFTGIPSSKTVCIGEGGFLETNDKCDCCTDESSSEGNSTGVVALIGCPTSCSCACDLRGETDQGVWITADVGNDSSPLNRCVDPRWAVSITSRFDRIQCLEQCPGE